MQASVTSRPTPTIAATGRAKSRPVPAAEDRLLDEVGSPPVVEGDLGATAAALASPSLGARLAAARPGVTPAPPALVAAHVSRAAPMIARDGATTVDAAAACARFIADHGAQAHLVAGLDKLDDKHLIWRNLVSNFFDRNDFSYGSNSAPPWSGRGDCGTLTSEYIETAAYFGIKAERASLRAPVIYVSPRPMVDKTHGNGNIDAGTGGWIFETHTWAKTEFGEADILFGQLGPVESSLGKESIDPVTKDTVCEVGGVQYSYAFGASAWNDKWTSDRSRWFGNNMKKK